MALPCWTWLSESSGVALIESSGVALIESSGVALIESSGVALIESLAHIPSIAFRHLPPNSSRFGNASAWNLTAGWTLSTQRASTKNVVHPSSDGQIHLNNWWRWQTIGQ